MQYRGNPSQLLAAKVRLISGAQIIFTTRKLKACLPSLKISLARELRSEMVYKLTCSGCNFTYVGQTVRHLATKVDEHRKGDSPVGQHLLECNKEVDGTAELKSEIIDQTAETYQLVTLEALHIWRERPRINTRDELRSRELTLKLYSMHNMVKNKKTDMSESKIFPNQIFITMEEQKTKKISEI